MKREKVQKNKEKAVRGQKAGKGMYGLEIRETKKQENTLNQKMELGKNIVLLLLCTAATMWCLFSLTGLEYQKGVFWGGMIFSALFVVAVLALPKWYAKLGAGLLYLVLLLSILWSQRGNFTEGFRYVANRILQLVNNYYQLGLDYYVTNSEEAEAVTIFLLFFVQLLLGIYAVALFSRRLRFLGRFLLLLAAAAGMAVGLVPDFWAMGAVVLCELLLLLPEQRVRAVLPPTVLFLVLFLLGGLIISEDYYIAHLKKPEQKQELLELYEKINTSEIWDGLVAFVEKQKQEPFWESFDFSGEARESYGLNGGRFGNYGKVTFDNVTALKVTLPDIQQSVYLKGFVGVNYTKSGWEEHDKAAEREYTLLKRQYQRNAQELPSWYLRMLLEEYTKDLSYSFFSSVLVPRRGSVQLWHAHMSVDYITANKEYVYAPYFWDVIQEKKISYIQDTYMESEKRTEHYSYEFYYLNVDALMGNWAEGVAAAAQKHTEWELFDAFEQAYREYVYEVYTEVPGGHEQLQNLYLAGEGDTTAEKIEAVVRYLSHYQYTLEPGKLPKGEDFVNYFLFENKKGYCVHFASSAVLLLRSMGVPARYAEGYLISESDIRKAVSTGRTLIAGYDGSFYREKTVDEKMVEVKDYSGHAWVEVYFDGFGWIPVEVTYGGGESVEDLPDEIYETMQEQPTSTPLPTNTPAPTLTPTPVLTKPPTPTLLPVPTLTPTGEPEVGADALTPGVTMPLSPDGEGLPGEEVAVGDDLLSEPEEKLTLKEWLATLSAEQRTLWWYGVAILSILLLMALLVLVIFLRYKLVWRMRIRSCRSRRGRVLWYYHAFERILAEYQLRLGREEAYRQFAERVMEGCPIVPENFPQILELALQAAFSKDRPSDEEIVLVRDAYLIMRERFYKERSRLFLLYYKFVKLY